MEEVLKLGFVGCGRHTCDSLLPSLRYVPEIELVAVCDTNKERAAEAARLFGVQNWFESIDDMLAGRQDIAAVIISVGSSLHASLSIAALRADRHVLVEKPPAVSSAEAMKVACISREMGKQVMVAFKKRFCPVYEKARQIVTSEEFGPISRIDVKFDMGLPKDRLKAGEEGGFTAGHARTHLDVSIHMLDLARFLAGDIKSIFSECGRNCTQVSSVTYDNGAIGSFSFGRSQSAQGPKERVEISGNGTLVVIDNQIRLTYYRQAIDQRLTMGTYIVEEDQAPVFYEPQFSLSSRENKALFYGGYVGELRHFARCILKGEMPSPTITDGVVALQLVEVLKKSVGVRVCLPAV